VKAVRAVGSGEASFSLEYPIVIDGRNLYRPKEMARAGFVYHSVGRPVADSRKHVLRGQIGRNASGIHNSLCRYCWLAPGTGATSQIGQSASLRFNGSLCNTSGANLLFVSAVMCNVVASGAKRNQVLLGIIAGMTPKLFVVGLQVRHGAARLTPPAVAP